MEGVSQHLPTLQKTAARVAHLSMQLILSRHGPLYRVTSFHQYFDTDNLLDQSMLGIILPLQFNPYSVTPSHILPLGHKAFPSGMLTLD